MFETAIRSDSDLSVVHGGSQQNGAILGNGCATFLAKFLTTLALTYSGFCYDARVNPSGYLYSHLYKSALETAL